MSNAPATRERIRPDDARRLKDAVVAEAGNRGVDVTRVEAGLLFPNRRQGNALLALRPTGYPVLGFYTVVLRFGGEDRENYSANFAPWDGQISDGRIDEVATAIIDDVVTLTAPVPA